MLEKKLLILLLRLEEKKQEELLCKGVLKNEIFNLCFKFIFVKNFFEKKEAIKIIYVKL